MSLKNRRQLQPMIQPNLVPMIDVVFQLVVFFMVSSTFVVAPGIGLALPESTTQEQVSMDLYQVTVSRDGTMYFQDQVVDVDQLGAKLESLTEAQKERVILQGEADVSLQDLIYVLDILRNHGIRNASILAKNPAPPEDQ